MPASMRVLARGHRVRHGGEIGQRALNAARFSSLSMALMLLEVLSSLASTVVSTFSSRALSEGLVRITGYLLPADGTQRRRIPRAAAEFDIGDAGQALRFQHRHRVFLDRRAALDREQQVHAFRVARVELDVAAPCRRRRRCT